MKKLFAFLALAVVSLIWTQSSQSFKLDDFLESLAKPPPPQSQPAKKQVPQQEAPKEQPRDATQQPAQKSGGGLIGLGESFGIFDKKTSRILQKSVGAVQAFQPIGLEEEKAIGGSLALEVFHRFGGMYKNAALQNYVNLVG